MRAGKKRFAAKVGSVTEQTFTYAKRHQQNITSRATSRARLPLSTLNKTGPSIWHKNNEVTRSQVLVPARTVSGFYLSGESAAACYKLMGTGEPAVNQGIIVTHAENNCASDFY